jgi:membrane protein YdbS with pleckstrin-like domain
MIAPIFLVPWFVKAKLWKFKVDNKEIHIKKIFTNQADLHIPLEQISGFSTEEGILEAIFGVETIIISTLSSNSDHKTIKFPYVNTKNNVTKYLAKSIAMSKNN